MTSTPPDGFADPSPTSAATHTDVRPGAPADSSRTPLLRDNQRFADYTIVRLIGRGGMGEVYEADDESGRRVALKVMNVAMSSPVALLRFLREGQLAASVAHPNTVYVFGSGEADGIPFLVSELVSGGTLADRLHTSGPLAISDAVDAILDVIAGLAAAAEVGVLHRDVKPSNCFVLRDGTVKIGDFGVSIPSDAQELTELTSTGVVVGTPAYCAPEQLRGEELDIRADIYSVGATLYCLLTGHPPFRGDSAIQVIEHVLTSTPRPLRKERREIPRRLDEIVSWCLDKRRERRPESCEGLSAALMPFSSASPLPAPLAARAVAALLDGLSLVAIWLFTNLIDAALPRSLALSTPAALVVRSVETVLYFALPEFWWGASFGKFLCGLRVAAADGSPVRLSVALWRASVAVLLVQVPMMTLMVRDPQTVARLIPLVGAIGVFAMFVTARASNGYSDVHELLSRSRTWERGPRLAAHPRASSEHAPTETTADIVGPYRIVRRYSADLALARDPRLKRLVWVRFASPHEPPLSRARIALDRPGRFRWLGGKHTSIERWDAFGYVEGSPFSSVATAALAFHMLARWLFTITRECQEAHTDSTLNSLSLDRLWVTRSGELMLADWTLPAAQPDPRADSATDMDGCQAFLRRVAEGVIRLRERRTPLPIYGRRLLGAIDERRFTHFDDLVAACADAASRDDSLSARRRVPPILAASIFAMVPVIATVSMLPRLSALSVTTQLSGQLFECLRVLESTEPGTGQPSTTPARDAAERCVSATSREVSSVFLRSIGQRPRAGELIDAARAKYPDETLADLDAAQALAPSDFGIWHFRREAATADAFRLQMSVMVSGVKGGVQLLGALGLICIACAALFRDGPLYRVLGIAIVRSDGSIVSRLQAIARATLTWLPAIGGAVAIWVFLPTGSIRVWPVIVGAMLAATMAAVAIHAALHPERGLADRLAGTYLVRR